MISQSELQPDNTTRPPGLPLAAARCFSHVQYNLNSTESPLSVTKLLEANLGQLSCKDISTHMPGTLAYSAKRYVTSVFRYNSWGIGNGAWSQIKHLSRIERKA